MCQPRLHAPVIPPGGKMCATNACGVGGLVAALLPVGERWMNSGADGSKGIDICIGQARMAG
jgi:hypothetical protein